MKCGIVTPIFQCVLRRGTGSQRKPDRHDILRLATDYDGGLLSGAGALREIRKDQAGIGCAGFIHSIPADLHIHRQHLGSSIWLCDALPAHEHGKSHR